jgi:hypothetical protein
VAHAPNVAHWMITSGALHPCAYLFILSFFLSFFFLSFFLSYKAVLTLIELNT